MNKFVIPLALLALAGCSAQSASVAPQPTVVRVIHEGPAPETAAQIDHRSYVAHLQHALVAKGYNVKVDGVCGPATQRAIAAYQYDLNVPRQTDGRCNVGDQTFSGLGMSPGDKTPASGVHFER